MSDHSLALVPLESWAYASPELLKRGRGVDIGLLAEALIYYDRVAFNVSNELQFAETIRWFWDHHCYSEFLSLLSDGTIQFYHYAFVSTTVGEREFTVRNIQTPIQTQPHSFEQHFLCHPSLGEFLPHGQIRDQLCTAFQKRVIEVKAEEFGDEILNAIEDLHNPERVALLMQALLDVHWPLMGLGKPPQVRAEVEVESQHDVWFNFYPDIDKLLGRIGTPLELPFQGGVQCNRFLWSSAKLECDLYMPSPMGVLIGDKLYECGKALMGKQDILETLQSRVEFPDIRQLVNNDRLSFKELLYIRSRRWEVS